MRIIVRGDSEKNIHLRIPTGLIVNRFAAGLLAGVMRQNGIHLTSGQAAALAKALNDCRRRHPDWVLVQVESADGSYVEIVV